MKEIKLKNSDIETVKMDIEFIHWTCPYCGAKDRTIEWSIKDQELFCMKCHKTTKYSWE